MCGYRVLHTTAKGGRQRVLRLAARTVGAVDGHPQDRRLASALVTAAAAGEPTPLVAANDGGRLDRHQLNRIVKRLANRAGLDAEPSPHTLRHTFATAALDAGASQRTVQDALGHAAPATTTRRYDSARGSLDRRPTEQVATWLGPRSDLTPTTRRTARRRALTQHNRRARPD